MSNKDEVELQALLSISKSSSSHSNSECSPKTAIERTEDKGFTGVPIQWASSNGTDFFPAGSTSKDLSPGVYDIRISQAGLFFSRVPIGTEKLLVFPDTNIEKVVKEIQKFWTRQEKFKQFGLTFKRGILMWGPPGSGKTCAIKLITRDIINLGGVVIRMGEPDVTANGLRIFRQIQPDTPVVVLIEDIDATIEKHNESDLLNILDGFEGLHKIVFVATTNYPEKLGPRIVNRPSRFDKRFKIGYPSDVSRRMYLEYIAGDAVKDIDIERYVADTGNEMSFAHLKELFTAHYIMGDEYKEALEMIENMKDNITSSQDNEGRTGFGAKRRKRHDPGGYSE
jgi:hypothetical protein